MDSIDGPIRDKLLVKLLNDDAQPPSRSTGGAAGYDIRASNGCIVSVNSRFLVSTGISINPPKGTYGRIAPRSGLSVKGIDVGAGVIDQDYRGEIKVLLINNSAVDFEVKKGDRIAQLIIEKIETPDVLVVTDLDETKRGDGGFGSTGTN